MYIFSDENFKMNRNNFGFQNATDEAKDKKMESDKSNGHVKMTDAENNSNNDESTVKTNEFVKIENAAPRCRDSSAERKLQVTIFSI